MFIRSALIGLTLAATATAALAGPSGQHSAKATYHSGEAASHAGAAAVSGVATVAAVPIIAVGSAIAITGEVLEEVGELERLLRHRILLRACLGEVVRDGLPLIRVAVLCADGVFE